MIQYLPWKPAIWGIPVDESHDGKNLTGLERARGVKNLTDKVPDMYEP
jgi:hypothetical protein